MTKKRGSFNSNFGAIAAAAGSAIGLGNIWRFPYVVGENGGAAFIIVYILIIALIGLPLIMTEFALGRSTHKNVFGTFRLLAPKTKWYLVGIIGIVGSLIILSFYSVIAGWTLAFLEFSITDSFSGVDPAQIALNFKSFVNGGVEPVLYMVLFIILTAIIVCLGVEKGIERYNKILMPILCLILIILSINSFTLSGLNEGLSFLFKPDFSKIDGSVVLSALGQAFFSMSIGMGCLMTYGSYLRKEDNIFRTAGYVAISDMTIAILAGIAIFPAVFTYGIEPGSGPDLVFITLPNIFAQMTGGYIFSIMFFILLAVAAITSSVSLMEVVVAYLCEEFKMKRITTVLIATLLAIAIGTLCAVSQMETSTIKIAGQNIFNLLDNFTSSYMLTISGFLIVLYAGWFMSKTKLREEIIANSSFVAKNYGTFLFLIRFIAPTAIIFVFLSKVGAI
ncbi:MAG: sodium-dependent transporter [Rikenellaceae bacterium]